MESEFSGHLLKAVERLAAEIGSLREEIKNLQRRQEAFEGMMQRVMAELRQEQAELRRRQDTLEVEWQDFGTRLNVYSAAWETRLQSQMRELEGFARQLENFTRQLAALLPLEE